MKMINDAELQSIEEIKSINSIIRKLNRERRMEEILEYIYPTIAAITFILILVICNVLATNDFLK